MSYTNGPVGSVSVRVRPFYCMCAARRREKEMKRMQEMEENKDKYTGKRSRREGVTDGEKLDPASEYNQFSYEPFFP